jgi:hypothetical protein
MEQFMDGQLDKADLEALQSDEEFEVSEDRPQVSERVKQEFLEGLAEANDLPSPEEVARVGAALERRREAEREHPLSRGAMEYSLITHRLIAALEPVLKAGGDPLAVESLEAITRHSMMIAVKTRRAVTALLPESEVLGDDDEFRQSDGNGCAKLVRLMVTESRDAWRLLGGLPSVAADGVPAAMAARLDGLDQQLARAFPEAMAFVRPGLDE